MGCCQSAKKRSAEDDELSEASADGSSASGEEHKGRRRKRRRHSRRRKSHRRRRHKDEAEPGGSSGDHHAEPLEPSGPSDEPQAAPVAVNPLTLEVAPVGRPPRSESSNKQSPTTPEAGQQRVSEGDIDAGEQKRRSTVFEDAREEAPGQDDFSTPERAVEAMTVVAILDKSTHDQRSEWMALYFNDPYRSKLKFKQIVQWTDEVGTVPPPTPTLVGERQELRLTSKQLEHNERVLLQLRQRTRTPGANASSTSSNDRRLSQSLAAKDRKLSRASNKTNNRVDRNEHDEGVGEFFHELAEEERRLSQQPPSTTSSD